MIPSPPRIFSIPASVPFLPTLARALVNGELVPGFALGTDPLALTRATIYLPTRRAGALAREAFLAELKTEAALLPRIVALGDIDEDEFVFGDASLAQDALTLPTELGGFERQAILATLVLKWAASPAVRGAEGAPLVANSPAAALALAGDLARLMDDFATRNVSWKGLDDLVPDNLDQYWQISLDFLRIARDAWPKLLAERGRIEPALRRDRLIAAETARLRLTPDAPVIAAGSTGSMPATAALLDIIAKLPGGAVVLPGLDTDLDEASWQAMAGNDKQPPAVGHPQFAMHALLKRFGITRSEVHTIGPLPAYDRGALVSEAMRPADATDLWQARLSQRPLQTAFEAAMRDITVIEAANAEEEALAVAVALRETIETPGATAALVTPDRALARRVTAALQRWQIAADDSGGDPLDATPAGVFARLAAEAALGGLEPVPLLALLKHPLCRLGTPRFTHLAAVAALERALLRGPRPCAGSASLATALAHLTTEIDRWRRREESELHGTDPRLTLRDNELAAAADLITRLRPAIAPLEDAAAGKPLKLTDFAARHRRVVETLSDDGEQFTALSGDDGAALLRVFEEIAALGPDADIALTPGDYAEAFEAAIAPGVVRRPGAPGARIRILGPLEARLTDATRVIVGGLVEGVWPPDVRSDPWLSRPMRQQLGLNLPELRIGLSAHDIAQLLGAPQVVLSRASKLGGAPTVASRFMQRLAAVAGETRWTEARKRGDLYLAWARKLDEPARVSPVARPEPKPPRALRPVSLSVTEIETWLRDPYSIYAKHILRLQPLDPIDTPPGARDRGTVIHGAIGDFTRDFADGLPADILGELIKRGEDQFKALEDFPEARAFWWPRFLRIAKWFAAWEQERRKNLVTLIAEERGEHEFDIGERRFRLRARADRIEQRDNGLAVLDYKTGTAPSASQVVSGLSPQLTLEAAILRNGGFPKIMPGSVAEFTYVVVKGGTPPGEQRTLDLGDTTPDAAADRALMKLTELAKKFEDEETPYRSLQHPMWKTHYGDYDHLARIKEWSLTAGVDDGKLGE